MHDNCYDVIIIGSGAGGLSAATALSNRDLRTLVLEAMPDVGGYLNPFKLDKYTFDGGMHYLGQLGEDGVFHALLERLGIWDSVRFNQINPDGFIRFVCGDFEFNYPAGMDRMKERLKEKFSGEAPAIDDFFEAILKIDHAVELAALIDTGRHHLIRALPHLPYLLYVLGKTYEDLVSSFTRNAELKKLLYAMNGGLPSNQVSALIPALMFRHYLDGAWYPSGGSGAMRDALVQRIRKNGGELLNHNKVVRVKRSVDRFTL